MPDIAKRFSENPLLTPADLRPSREGLKIISLLNPGVFSFAGKTWLLVRVAEGPAREEGVIFFPALDNKGNTVIKKVALNDPDLIATDARVISYKGQDYLTTLSHLKLLCSDDGVKFYEPEQNVVLTGTGPLERFGIEDCRVSKIENTYYLTYTAVSDSGVGVGLRTTIDWQIFEHKGMILPPHNKDCAIFEQKINGSFFALHRPSSKEIGGNYIWIAESPDGTHWGNHQCIIQTRPGLWDSARVGAGAAPVKTDKGWLAVYHGANGQHQYCLGAFLMDLNNPYRVLARTIDAIMMPGESYELNGFFNSVVFTNGHIINGDELTVYYGAADEFVCGATFSINDILAALRPV